MPPVQTAHFELFFDGNNALIRASVIEAPDEQQIADLLEGLRSSWGDEGLSVQWAADSISGFILPSNGRLGYDELRAYTRAAAKLLGVPNTMVVVSIAKLEWKVNVGDSVFIEDVEVPRR